MKRTSLISIISVILLTAVSCEDKFYMPFKETDKGDDKVSFYLDGVGMRSFHQRGYLAQYEETTFAWADSSNYVFKSRAGEEGNGYGWGDIIIDIRLEEPDTISSGTTYNITQYTKPLTAQEDSLNRATPHVWISFEGMYASEGWIEFRKYSKGIASGNFEMDFTDNEGQAHTVRYGNFDSAPMSFSEYNPPRFYPETPTEN